MDYYHEDWSLCALGNGFQNWYRVDLHYLAEPKGLGSQFTSANCFPQVTLEGSGGTPVIRHFPRPGRIQDHVALAESKILLIGVGEIQYGTPIRIAFSKASNGIDNIGGYHNYDLSKIANSINQYVFGSGLCWKVICAGRGCLGFSEGCFPKRLSDFAENYQTRVGTWLWWLDGEGNLIRDQRLDRMYVQQTN